MASRINCTLAFVAGILAPKLEPTQVIALLALFAFVCLWNPKLRTTLAMSLTILSFAVGLGRALGDEHQSAKPLNFKAQTVEGLILEPPRQWGNSSVFFFQIESTEDGMLKEPMKILVRWSHCEHTLEVGDRWSLEGRYQKGERSLYPGGFDQKEWLWTQGCEGVFQIHKFGKHHYISPPLGFSPHQLSYRARSWMLRKLRKIEDERARSLVAGVVFGETQSLPKDLQEMFRRTGTSHLLAASGMNVALLAGLIIGAGKLLGFGPWRTAPWAIPAVIAYAFLAGCAPSITRAATGTSLALLAISWGRTSNAWNTLALSSWLLLLWNPRQVYDLGFQLSAVAVVGLVGGPEAPKALRGIGSSLVLTFSASLLTLPIFWWAFGELSSTLLLSNLLLGPLVELLFPLGLLLTLCPLKPLLWLSEKIAQVSILLVEWLSALADPILLTRPTALAWLCMLSAIAVWLKGKGWSSRCLALPLIVAALVSSLHNGYASKCPSGQIIIRKVGREKPIYWISTPTREVLIVQEAWQKTRAQSMLRQMGCLVIPECRELQGAPLRFQWGELRWQAIEPLLPPASFITVTAHAGSYRVKTWDPEDFQESRVNRDE